MGYRRFVDRDGRAWEVRDKSRTFWEFAPAAGNRANAVEVRPPGYERDPFEMSNEELQRLLDSVEGPARRGPRKSPFDDL